MVDEADNQQKSLSVKSGVANEHQTQAEMEHDLKNQVGENGIFDQYSPFLSSTEINALQKKMIKDEMRQRMSVPV